MPAFSDVDYQHKDAEIVRCKAVRRWRQRAVARRRHPCHLLFQDCRGLHDALAKDNDADGLLPRGKLAAHEAPSQQEQQQCEAPRSCFSSEPAKALRASGPPAAAAAGGGAATPSKPCAVAACKGQDVGGRSEDNLLAKLGRLLQERMGSSSSAADGVATNQERATSFHARRATSFSVDAVLTRLRQTLGCSDAAFVMASVYVDRAAQFEPLLELTPLTFHRLWLTCLYLATKFHDDVEVKERGVSTTSRFAKAGGLDGKQEVARLEAKLLAVLGWRLNITPKEYQERCELLCLDAPSC
eukprot:TRINITY_DN18874_c0_g1_i3.p1 TRINITY_DN18874_c0_g1~~TRINITY_DN18874_c0_g1_i3.p1  ORF type:complete len:299 (-),score=69.63 TRINITY_DN18874_c0_g1_i3:556-1452(-)